MFAFYIKEAHAGNRGDVLYTYFHILFSKKALSINKINILLIIIHNGWHMVKMEVGTKALASDEEKGCQGRKESPPNNDEFSMSKWKI